MLESWKEISAYLRRNVRTCRLWECRHGLPIHRLDESPKARVFAYPEELDRWLEEKLYRGEPPDPSKQARGKTEKLPVLPLWSKGLIIALSIVAVAAVAVTVGIVRHHARVRWADEVAVPEIERLVLTPDRPAAFDLLMKAQTIIPGSPLLASLEPLIVSKVSFKAVPPGADIRLKDYSAGSAWVHIGAGPIVKTPVCQGYKRWRIDLDGRQVAEGAFHARAGYEIEIDADTGPSGTVPPGMVFVRGGRHRSQTPEMVHLPAVELKDFVLDRHEVTNSQFKEFVDAGGYKDPRYWKYGFIADGRALSWERGIKVLVDRSGLPGPAAWRSGTYAEGAADLPVSGVSWYEAAAYAEFAGKTLPSVYHWEWASGNYHEDSGHIIKASNFGGQGLTAVGQCEGLGPCGTYDMAGNVKEWCANEVGGVRVLRGGAWNEPEYLFDHLDCFPPLTRSENFGFRCMKEIPGLGGAPEAFHPFELMASTAYETRKPCSDEVFEAYRSTYAYTRSDLAAEVESVRDWSDKTTIEKVAFDDAYGEERVTAYLFLPKHGHPPYQTVIYYPGDSAWSLDSVFDYGTVKSREAELFTGSGRAFVFPVFKGTFERRKSSSLPPTRQRRLDAMIRWYRDLARCLDYLGTRPDIDMEKLAYQGLSGGGSRGVIFVALEKRFKAAILMSGGLFPSMYVPELYVPQVDVIHFAPRVRIPVLMQNGKYDYMLPWKTTIERPFELLGTPEGSKRLIAYESGHSIWFLNEYRKDIFEFLDRYLGPVVK